MTHGRRHLLISVLSLPFIAACNRIATAGGGTKQTSPKPSADLYQCEGCDGAFERPSSNMDWHTEMAEAAEPGQEFVFEGVVYQVDGKSPAPGIVLYAYHTNAEGLYANGTKETEWSRRHGRLRGWVKTDANGRYRFKSIKPAPYPNDILPAHVHITVLEPTKRPYWIDDIVFNGEFGVTEKYRTSMIDKGGNGITQLERSPSGTWLAHRDIVLGRHP